MLQVQLVCQPCSGNEMHFNYLSIWVCQLMTITMHSVCYLRKQQYKLLNKLIFVKQVSPSNDSRRVTSLLTIRKLNSKIKSEKLISQFKFILQVSNVTTHGELDQSRNSKRRKIAITFFFWKPLRKFMKKLPIKLISGKIFLSVLSESRYNFLNRHKAFQITFSITLGYIILKKAL